MQITSSRDNESTSAAGFNEADCTEEKEDLILKGLKDRLEFQNIFTEFLLLRSTSFPQ